MKLVAWTDRSPHHRVAGRLFWALLVLIHIPALAGATRSLIAEPDLFHALSLLALVVTVACFVLKLAGVRFLPNSNTHGRALVFILIAALVHHEAAATAAERLIDSPALPAAVVTTLLVGEGLRRVARHLPDLKTRLAAWLTSYCGEHLLVGVRTLPVALRLRPSRFTRLLIPRAPPA